MANLTKATKALDANSTPAERKAANDDHHRTLISHTLDAATYGGHGHAVGKGATGKMVPSDAHMQGDHAYIPQGVLPANRQNTSSDGAGSAEANDPSTSDYGTVDKNG